MKLSAIMTLVATAAIVSSGYSSGTDEVVHLSEALIQTTGDPEVSAGVFYGYRSHDIGPGDNAFSNALEKAVSSGVLQLFRDGPQREGRGRAGMDEYGKSSVRLF